MKPSMVHYCPSPSRTIYMCIRWTLWLHSLMGVWKKKSAWSQPEGYTKLTSSQALHWSHFLEILTGTCKACCDSCWCQSQATQEGSWLRRLLNDLGMDAMPAVILEDNQGANGTEKNPACHSRTKHRDIRQHYIRECVQNGRIELKYRPTNELKADILTKPLTKQKFEYLRREIGLFPMSFCLIGTVKKS